MTVPPAETPVGLPAAELRATEMLEEVRGKLAETRSSLNAKVESARHDNEALRSVLNAKLESARRDRETLRGKLLETRENLNGKIEELRDENRELRRKVALYERRHLMKNVDALAHNRESAMDDFFADVEDETPYRRFGSALREQLAAMDLSFDGRSVADTGVGPGLALHELLLGSTPKAVVGYDFSAKALDVARTVLPQAHFEHRGMYDLPDERFDVVICTEVLEHLERPAVALRSLVTLLEKQGTLILTVPDGRIDFSAKHVNFWSPESWKLFLQDTLPEQDVRTAVFAPYPETGHQTNLGLITRP